MDVGVGEGLAGGGWGCGVVRGGPGQRGRCGVARRRGLVRAGGPVARQDGRDSGRGTGAGCPSGHGRGGYGGERGRGCGVRGAAPGRDEPFGTSRSGVRARGCAIGAGRVTLPGRAVPGCGSRCRRCDQPYGRTGPLLPARRSFGAHASFGARASFGTRPSPGSSAPGSRTRLGLSPHGRLRPHRRLRPGPQARPHRTLVSANARPSPPAQPAAKGLPPWSAPPRTRFSSLRRSVASRTGSLRSHPRRSRLRDRSPCPGRSRCRR